MTEPEPISLIHVLDVLRNVFDGKTQIYESLTKLFGNVNNQRSRGIRIIDSNELPTYKNIVLNRTGYAYKQQIPIPNTHILDDRFAIPSISELSGNQWIMNNSSIPEPSNSDEDFNNLIKNDKKIYYLCENTVINNGNNDIVKRYLEIGYIIKRIGSTYWFLPNKVYYNDLKSEYSDNKSIVIDNLVERPKVVKIDTNYSSYGGIFTENESKGGRRNRKSRKKRKLKYARKTRYVRKSIK